MKLLVTGGAGFIGSTYVRLFADDHEVVVLDKLTYAGRRENLPDGVELVVGGIEDRDLVRQVADGVDAVVNFAAESHVDRSIADQDVVRAHARDRHGRAARRGPRAGRAALPAGLDRRGLRLDRGGLVHRDLAARPVLALLRHQGRPATCSSRRTHHTYGIEAVICRGSNNYGPRQYPEKLIPLAILNALHGDPLPVYGDGRQVRNWLYVEDFCRGIHTVLERGRPGEAYNVGGPDECENIDVVRRILELTGRDESLIEHVTDRPGHDRRYSLELGQAARRARLGGGGALRRTASPAPSSGTATTRTGGARSARASTASTTRSSTAARSASPALLWTRQHPRSVAMFKTIVVGTDGGPSLLSLVRGVP